MLKTKEIMGDVVKKAINVIMQSIMTAVVMMIGFFFFMAFSFLKDWFYSTSLFYDVVVWV